MKKQKHDRLSLFLVQYLTKNLLDPLDYCGMWPAEEAHFWSQGEKSICTTKLFKKQIVPRKRKTDNVHLYKTGPVSVKLAYHN